MSVETSPSGVPGRDLIEQALAIIPRGEQMFAAVAPGNARSLRSFLSCGFVPIGSEVLIRVGSLGNEKEGQVV
jgi:L-amino acid N-acyltransferase YncA